MTALVRRVVRRLRRETGTRTRRVRDRRRPAYALARQERPPGALASFLPALDPSVSSPPEVLALYARGWFDLLGSGWKLVSRPTWSVEPGPNSNESRRVWDYVDSRHTPIAWDRDVRSRHQWDPRVWHGDVPIQGPPGSDIKVPWELGRLQHLPQLAFAGAEHASAFRNHLLDFIASNPPGFGVQWACTMDVAIRVANIVLGYDILRSTGVELDDAVQEIILGSVYDHAAFIRENLEWNPRWSGNHYLADLCGLAWAAAYLPASSRTDEWLAFAFTALAGEVGHQFDSDGVNTEGSTSYHRLSGEMVCWTAALRAAIPARRLEPGPLFDPRLLDGIARFSRSVSGPDGRVIQVGDNDSGRFFKLSPAWVTLTVDDAAVRYANLDGYDALPAEATYWREDSLDHRHLVRAIEALSGVRPPDDAETRVLVSLAGGTMGTPRRTRRQTVQIGATWPAARLAALDTTHGRRRVTIRPGGSSLTDGLSSEAYTGFGLYLWRSPRLFLAVRCGPLGQAGLGGHNHNDQLAVELMIDGQPWLQDRGTATYTADPELRDRYRSVAAHAAPRLGAAEPWRLDGGLFLLQGDPSGGTPLYLNDRRFVGEHRGFGPPVVRSVTIEADGIVVEDHLPGMGDEDLMVTCPDEAETAFGPFPPRSPAYGWVERE